MPVNSNSLKGMNDRNYPISRQFYVREILLSILSAFFLTLSFPTFNLEFLAWFALVPLLTAIKDKSPGFSFILCFLTGISFFMGVFSWINDVRGFTVLYFFILGIYLGSYFGIFGLLLTFISKRSGFSFPIIAPALWVSLEYLRSHAGFLALPWALLGHSQYLNLPIIQISSFTGAYGVSFLIILINSALGETVAFMLHKKRQPGIKDHPVNLKAVFVAMLLFGLSLVYGIEVLSVRNNEDRINITVIQGNIPQDVKWNPKYLRENLDKHIRLTEEASDKGPTSLIVWPETSIPRPITQDLYLMQTIPNLAREVKTHVLIGSSQRPKYGSGEFRMANSFNSAFLISPQGIFKGQYKKIHLLPFGEFLPLNNIFPWPSKFVSFISETGNIIPGSEYTIFRLEKEKFGVLICWENIFPGLFRKFVKNGAQFIVNITNEAWFGETAAPYQFLSMNVFRAVENRIAIVRSANTGISCFIEPNGKVIGRVQNNKKDVFVEGYLTKSIPLLHEKTFILDMEIFFQLSVSLQRQLCSSNRS